MECLLGKLGLYRGTCLTIAKNSSKKSFKRNYTVEEPVQKFEKNKITHPYRQIHPWKSLSSFSTDLLNNLIYNKGGLVVLNKPYGISAVSQNSDTSKMSRTNVHKLAHSVDYTITDSLQYISTELGYDNLIIVKSPERYMTGVTILAASRELESKVKKSLMRAVGSQNLYRTYWAITTMMPKQREGKMNLAMELKYDSNADQKKPVIITKWSRQAEKEQRVKVLNIEFKVLSNSTLNLSSMLEIKTSTTKWHAIRLFAATVLYSPILGDNYHASRIQNTMGTWLPVNPFLPSTERPPQLNKELMKMLYIIPATQEIIPVHLHLRSIYLPSLFKKNQDLTFEASLLPPFTWTCEQLKFKEINQQSVDEENLPIQLTAS